MPSVALDFGDNEYALVECPRCGTLNDPSLYTCITCGFELDEDTHADYDSED